MTVRFVMVGAAPTRLDAERARVVEMLARAAPPVSCGPEMPVAPARGPMFTFQPREMVVTEAGGRRSVRTGYRGRDAAQVADVFHRMEAAARSRHARAAKRAQAEGRDVPVFVPPFDPGQVEAARDYAALSERVACSGVKCSSLEAQSGGSGGNGSREEAMLADFQRLRALHRRIGSGLAREVRRIRPEGRKRRAIRVRTLVDLVCLGGVPLSAVLRRHGWAVDAGAVEGLRRSLAAALDRMRGYDLDRPRN